MAKLLFGNYGLYGYGAFTANEVVEVSQEVYEQIKDSYAVIGDKKYLYFETWVEEEPVSELPLDEGDKVTKPKKPNPSKK